MKMKLVVLTRPMPGREDEYNTWYDTKHMPQLVNAFGMAGAQRYKLAARYAGNDVNEYLAIYDVDADDPVALLAAIDAASLAGTVENSDVYDEPNCYAALFTEHGERVVPD